MWGVKVGDGTSLISKKQELTDKCIPLLSFGNRILRHISWGSVQEVLCNPSCHLVIVTNPAIDFPSFLYSYFLGSFPK